MIPKKSPSILPCKETFFIAKIERSKRERLHVTKEDIKKGLRKLGLKRGDCW